MYGIGARLDEQPELLFLLRGVDHGDLISGETDAAAALTGAGSRRSRRRTVTDADLSAVFGVELEADAVTTEAVKVQEAKRPADKKKSRPAAKRTKPSELASPMTAATSRRTRATRDATPRKRAPFKPTGRSVARLRARLAMSVADFARAVGVSPASVMNWERSKGAIRPHAKSLAGLQRLHDVD